MKQILTLALSVLIAAPALAWSPKGDKIKTKWAAEVTPQNAWQNYPRPQLKREAWQNLNGLWQYKVTDQSATKPSAGYDGEILVPFAIESALSGVAQTFGPSDKLWYRREFTIDPSWKGKQINLHFGAVDYTCHIWVNNKEVGTHTGGNNPFSFDISKYLKGSGTQVLEVSVTDPTDTESITRGKQQLDQKGIWYTPVSGIWQTVWLEPVNKTSIRSLLPVADIKQNSIGLHFDIAGLQGNETIKVDVTDNGRVIATSNAKAGSHTDIRLPQITLWSPTSPKLYGLQISLMRNNREIDKAESYFAMREVTKQQDEQGHYRTCLNGTPLFQYGTLDQGWWPDGLLTPPSAEAMLWDMVQLKEMGFNTIRKHIKVEPALYYYYADSLGLMMWQDMPSGFATARKDKEHVSAKAAQDWDAPEAVAQQWWKELNEMVDNLRFFPCITTWVVFNEGWGQHHTQQIVPKVIALDPTRIVNGVSGWTDRKVGNMYDVHNYPSTSMILPANTNGRISVLGEFGGLGLPIAGSLWNPNMRNWGYKNIEGGVDLASDYSRLVFDLETLIAQGLSAAIYTQTTDVEGEVNGLITYDRKITKLPVEFLNILHSRLYKIKPAQTTTLARKAAAPFAETTSGTVRSVQEFSAAKAFDNLSLFIHVKGKTTVRINGVEVFNQEVRLTRSPNQYNLSDYSRFLKPGNNLLEVEVTTTTDSRPGEFDYSLNAF